ncbi:hypothetical protein COW36_10520 [bacterium (Candidatus Blackallbacteria) CG17_big_fil_post_rev_8_21_14_2_50_48_46]|uniref:YbjN domain-containing protein n=1 Tax=bacterium (Candidatus Blackallbacteria) CG17_big_fil_post_rev_8_21_14_2_50_48_46 TaxID=2014261 RepID=A0A2M7G564_9BACT|nr:MAG: hypothetical protein COW64_20295 [bacterium (Candidatus Blackallbacteria) CG18_big_fil_WC_8_21_14_2_50_49_26]PIW17064.1 MAG: hypothetical protein COW36_10520 [bacterium (Candidatus Blackallbacteria) CG17_big_fil_post_rev_8_21_14_2_50_48_46]PIW47701.1 MAG: hypothetical protein COW20_11700 [bacterium (Candidatus Blackallbacteria) CG13_big_fil_rev_8_21_14_2_50_49_14]
MNSLSTVASQGHTETPLKRLHQILSYVGFNSHLIPQGEENHFDALLVALDEDQEPDQEEFSTIAQIFFSEDLLRSEALPDIQEELENSVTLQFLVHSSLDAANLNAERLLGLYQFLTRCNRIMPIGHFDLDPEQKIFFHYGLKAENRNIPAALIIDSLENFGFFINRMAPLIQDFIQSERSLEDLSTQLEEDLSHAIQQYLPRAEEA